MSLFFSPAPSLMSSLEVEPLQCVARSFSTALALRAMVHGLHQFTALSKKIILCKWRDLKKTILEILVPIWMLVCTAFLVHLFCRS